MFAHALALGATRNTSSAIAGSALTVWPQAATWHYHAAYGVTSSSGRITTINDQSGNGNHGTAGVSGSSLGGPLITNEVYGPGGTPRPLMRVLGTEYLNIPTSVTVTHRSFWFCAIMRMPKTLAGMDIFGGGNVDAGTAASANTGGKALLSTNGSGKTPIPYLKASNVLASTGTGYANLATHGGLHLCAVFVNASRQRIYINGVGINLALQATNAGAMSGAELFRYPNAPGTKSDAPNYNSGSWYQGDCYEVAGGSQLLSDAQADAQVAAMLANWSDIIPLTDELCLTGDSIMGGTTSVPSASPAQLLTEPGHPLAVKRSTRVTNVGISGYTVADLVTGRDTADSIGTAPKLSGGRTVCYHVGRNDAHTSLLTAQQIYDAEVAYINTVTTGLRQRSIRVIPCCPLAVSIGADETVLSAVATKLIDPQFFTDTGCSAAELKVENPRLITLSGQTQFANSTDAGNATVYNTGLHVTATGYQRWVFGADTPQYGMAYAATSWGL